jgi:antitoxin component YwqK of YwqJK toxin-antitoxin module
MKTKIVFCIILLLFFKEGFSQIPQSPNTINSKGLKEGLWTILYNQKSKETKRYDSVKFYRKVNFSNGKPIGTVRDYYLSGTIKWEGKLKSINPDVFDDGYFIEKDEGGKISSEGEYKNNLKKDYGNIIFYGWVNLMRRII